MAPPHHTQFAQKEGRIALAIQALQKGHVSNVHTAAQMYNIPDKTLRRRVKGINARRDSIPINRKLTTTEESTLIKWILFIDQRGLLVRSNSI
jgi:hypothetical protein